MRSTILLCYTIKHFFKSKVMEPLIIGHRNKYSVVPVIYYIIDAILEFFIARSAFVDWS